MSISANQHPIDMSSERWGDLCDHSALLDDPAALKKCVQTQGYLFFRRLLPADVVLDARREILLKYAVLGEIDDRLDVMEARAGDRSGVGVANLRAFSRSVRGGASYSQVVDSPILLGVVESLLDGSVKSFDFRWPRLARPGEGCGFHCDGPYMARGTSIDRIFTSWIPLGRVHRNEGALIILEGSHENEALKRTYLDRDADTDKLEWLSVDPNELSACYGGRWLSADFEVGDVLFITMGTVHGALDNNSRVGRCRLSSDSRYQRADEPFDPRWNGDDPEGHGGSRVFYPGLGRWNNIDFQDEWKFVDDRGRLVLGERLPNA